MTAPKDPQSVFIMFPLWVAWHFHDSFFFAVHPFLISPPPTLPCLSPPSTPTPHFGGPIFIRRRIFIFLAVFFSLAREKPSILILVSFGGPYGGWTTGRGNEMDNRTAVRSRGRICLASNACSLKKKEATERGARFHVFESLRLNTREACLLFAIEAEERD